MGGGGGSAYYVSILSLMKNPCCESRYNNIYLYISYIGYIIYIYINMYMSISDIGNSFHNLDPKKSGSVVICDTY